MSAVDVFAKAVSIFLLVAAAGALVLQFYVFEPMHAKNVRFAQEHPEINPALRERVLTSDVVSKTRRYVATIVALAVYDAVLLLS